MTRQRPWRIPILLIAAAASFPAPAQTDPERSTGRRPCSSEPRALSVEIPRLLSRVQHVRGGGKTTRDPAPVR
jgi:hypothetical protein